MGFLLLFLLFALLVRIPPNQDRFKSSGYKEASGHSLFETILDPGRNGEFLIYSCLECFGEEHKLLTEVWFVGNIHKIYDKEFSHHYDIDRKNTKFASVCTILRISNGIVARVLQNL